MELVEVEEEGGSYWVWERTLNGVREVSQDFNSRAAAIIAKNENRLRWEQD